MVKKEDVPFLNQLIRSLEEAELKIEEAYMKKHDERFNKAKGIAMEIQEKISEVIG